MGEWVIGVKESPVLDLSGNWSVSFLEAWHCSAGILPKVKRKPSSDGVGELRRPRPEDIKEIPVPLPQGLFWNGRLPALSSAMAGEEDAEPGSGDWVAGQKSGHSRRLMPQCLPWFIPVSPSTHHLWIEVGGRKNVRRRTGRDESGKNRSAASSSAESQTWKELPDAT